MTLESAQALARSNSGGGARWVAGLSMVLVGALLLLSVAAFHAYGWYASTGFDELNATVDEAAFAPAAVAERLASLSVFSSTPKGPPATSAPAPQSLAAGLVVPAVPALAADEETETRPDSTLPASVFSSIYPGGVMHPKYWGQPLWAGSEPFVEPPFPGRYRPVSAESEALDRGGLLTATRILIPAIGVDSDVSELAILDLGDSRAYETPANIVGHIPSTSNPGEYGDGWFFGHLESPIKGEGNVFLRLPEIAGHLRDGDPIYVSLVTAADEYLYLVDSSGVIPKSDLKLTDNDPASITLVACYPRLIYDHRVVVTARLVGIAD